MAVNISSAVADDFRPLTVLVRREGFGWACTLLVLCIFSGGLIQSLRLGQASYIVRICL